ncbi:MAG: GNAT family N-acetyltransferase [Pikeienuella sp.]
MSLRIDIPEIATDRLVLRGPRLADIPAWTAFLGSERARFVGGPLDAETAWRVFATISGHWLLRGYGAFVFALRGDDRAIGWAGAWHPAGWPACELTYTLWDPDLEGRGLAAEAARAARAFLQGLGIGRLMSYVDPANIRSVRLAERLGAERDTAGPPARFPQAIAFRHPAPERAA